MIINVGILESKQFSSHVLFRFCVSFFNVHLPEGIGCQHLYQWDIATVCSGAGIDPV